jgi:hypothetical protein
MTNKDTNNLIATACAYFAPRLMNELMIIPSSTLRMDKNQSM